MPVSPAGGVSPSLPDCLQAPSQIDCGEGKRRGMPCPQGRVLKIPGGGFSVGILSPVIILLWYCKIDLAVPVPTAMSPVFPLMSQVCCLHFAPFVY